MHPARPPAVASLRLVLQSRLSSAFSFPVVMSSGIVLMLSAPACTLEDVSGVRDGGPGGAGDEAPDFGQGERYELWLAVSGAPSLALMAVRKAWASMERGMCRYQPVYWRTWHGPARPRAWGRGRRSRRSPRAWSSSTGKD